MALTAAIITVSDSCAQGLREDKSGPAIAEILVGAGYEVVYTKTVADEKDEIKNQLVRCSDELKTNLVFTTGGTGFSHRDVTPEATLEVVERETPFIVQAMFLHSMSITPKAMLSRMAAGIRADTIIVNLPGSPKAASENLTAVIGTMEHAIKMLGGEGH